MRVDRLNIALAAAAALLVCAPASAQQTEPQPNTGADTQPDEIEVIGRRQSEEQARKEANDFVRRTLATSSDDPLARWVSPVCPAVLGIQPEYAAVVERKIRAIARTAEIELAPAPCKSNVVISFATDAKAVVQRIAKKSPRRLAEVQIPDRPALLTGNAPVRWWYTTQETGADGASAVTSDGLAANAGTAEGGGSSIGNGLPTVQAYSSSIIRTQIVRALRSATIVIDVSRAEGVPLDAVAAYAAMVAFAEMKPAQVPPPNSILGLFAPDAKVAGATDWDISFLKALYSIPAARAGWKQRRMLVGKILKDSEAAGQIDNDEDLTEGLAEPKG
ncbi:hypothetical protein [Sphingomonas sp. 35-24ZXX]|uniref:hypothetical protein n=1 Tax=Sphingomonas sp. 35-24ZXX TaxID=1545915 RepID=UPI000689E822|nr:hypothetical protein [Sphingomonas sp. 35-24ZXX]